MATVNEMLEAKTLDIGQSAIAAAKAAADIAEAGDLIRRAALMLDRLPPLFVRHVETIEGGEAIDSRLARRLSELADLIDLAAEVL